MPRKGVAAKAKSSKKAGAQTLPRCGLCARTGNLTKTECCDQWICDDEDNYVLFSYARNSCSRNHTRYTLCGFHSNERHRGAWQDCNKCRQSFEAEMYAYYGTNEFNFMKLANPPAFEPTRCTRCNKVVNLGTDAYSVNGANTFCSACFSL